MFRRIWVVSGCSLMLGLVAIVGCANKSTNPDTTDTLVNGIPSKNIGTWAGDYSKPNEYVGTDNFSAQLTIESSGHYILRRVRTIRASAQVNSDTSLEVGTFKVQGTIFTLVSDTCKVAVAGEPGLAVVECNSIGGLPHVIQNTIANSKWSIKIADWVNPADTMTYVTAKQ